MLVEGDCHGEKGREMENRLGHWPKPPSYNLNPLLISGQWTYPLDIHFLLFVSLMVQILFFFLTSVFFFFLHCALVSYWPVWYDYVFAIPLLISYVYLKTRSAVEINDISCSYFQKCLFSYLLLSWFKILEFVSVLVNRFYSHRPIFEIMVIILSSSMELAVQTCLQLHCYLLVLTNTWLEHTLISWCVDVKIFHSRQSFWCCWRGVKFIGYSLMLRHIIHVPLR